MLTYFKFYLLSLLTLLELNSEVYFHWQIIFSVGQILLSKSISDLSLKIKRVELTVSKAICSFYAPETDGSDIFTGFEMTGIVMEM